jgi:thiol-disulfide isomerase/thioredoxin
VTPGLIALIVALACAGAAGVAWRRRNGRMRTVGGRAGAAAAARPAGGPAAEDQGPRQDQLPVLTSDQLGRALGERATLVQFSSAFCAPCRATRRILADVAGMTEGVAHIEIDAESRLDLVRSLNVVRTPTVLVADSAGRVIKRASGQPRKADVIAAVGQVIPTYLVGKEDSDSSTQRA